METSDIQPRVHAALRARLGYDDVFSAPPSLTVTHYGGGCIVTAGTATPLRELHIVPHGGSAFPAAYAWALGDVDADHLTECLVANIDSSTSALAAYLAHTLRDPAHHDRAVAYFDCTRLLVDANRLVLDEQVPAQPYRGQAVLKPTLTSAEKETLVTALLQPWTDALQAIVQQGTLALIMHHHTYDEYGTGTVQHEAKTTDRRPAGMLFQRSGPLASTEPHANTTFLAPALVDGVVAILHQQLQTLDPTAAIKVDWPYTAPQMLAHRLAEHGTPGSYQSVIYEVRKDLLVGPAALHTLTQTVEALSTYIRHAAQRSAAD